MSHLNDRFGEAGLSLVGRLRKFSLQEGLRTSSGPQADLVFPGSAMKCHSCFVRF